MTKIKCRNTNCNQVFTVQPENRDIWRAGKSIAGMKLKGASKDSRKVATCPSCSTRNTY